MVNYDELGKERNFRLNKPTYEPGQGWDEYSEGFGMSTDWAAEYAQLNEPEPQSSGLPVAGSTYQDSMGQNTGYGIQTGLENGYQVGYSNNNSYGLQSQVDNRPAKERIEDLALDLGSRASVGSWNFLKMLRNSAKTQTRKGYREFFHKSMLYGIIGVFIAVVLSIVLKLTGWGYKPPIGLFWAGGLVAFTGFIRSLSTKYYVKEEPKNIEGTTENTFEEFSFNEETPVEESTLEGSTESVENDGEDIDYTEFKNLWGIGGSNKEKEVEEQVVTTDDKEPNLDSLNNGLYTRNLLVDLMKEGLPTENPTYAESVELVENSTEFMGYLHKVKEAAEAANIPYENQPVLETVWANLFTTVLKCKVDTNPVSIQTMVSHLESLLRYNDMGQIVNDSVQVTGNVVGKNIFFTLVWNKGKLLYQGDLMHQTDIYTDWCNNKLKMPVTWGVDEKGKSVTTDLDNVVSMIVSGPPESGKTEFIIRLITSTMFVTSPRELNFLFASPKAIEDYGVLKELPHVKGFETDPYKINDMLDWLIEEESERRKKKLHQYGVSNAKEFNANLPEGEKPMATLWVVLDEMATIQAVLEQEELKEYKKKLRTIATQFRSVNIKLMMLPHRITESMIPKDVYSIADVRGMFRATEDALKEGLGVSSREFPFKLNQRGDYALKHKDINNGTAKYFYTPLLTLGSKAKIVEQIQNIWGRLEPEEYAESWEDFRAFSHTESNEGGENTPENVNESYHQEVSEDSMYYSNSSEIEKGVEKDDEYTENFEDEDEDEAGKIEESFWDQLKGMQGK